MKVTWEVDEATRVEAHYKPFGKEVVLVNGQKAIDRRSLSYKIRTPFPLDGGRKAVISTRARFFLSPEISLHVDGQPCTPLGKTPDKCPKCRANVRSFDKFCDGCGAALPTAETREHEKHVRDATNVMFVLAGMFAFFGAVIFFVSHDEEVWDILITNGVLAAVMLGLGLWGRRAPLPAILVASATYAMVIVTNAIIEPASIAQGILVKVIVIMLLVKGVKAALALRASQATPPAT